MKVAGISIALVAMFAMIFAGVLFCLDAVVDHAFNKIPKNFPVAVSLTAADKLKNFRLWHCKERDGKKVCAPYWKEIPEGSLIKNTTNGYYEVWQEKNWVKLKEYK